MNYLRFPFFIFFPQKLCSCFQRSLVLCFRSSALCIEAASHPYLGPAIFIHMTSFAPSLSASAFDSSFLSISLVLAALLFSLSVLPLCYRRHLIFLGGAFVLGWPFAFFAFVFLDGIFTLSLLFAFLRLNLSFSSASLSSWFHDSPYLPILLFFLFSFLFPHFSHLKKTLTPLLSLQPHLKPPHNTLTPLHEAALEPMRPSQSASQINFPFTNRLRPHSTKTNIPAPSETLAPT